MTKPAKSFDAICREASTAFLQTVVVIDNEASLQADKRLEEPAKRTAVRKRSATPDPRSHIEPQATSAPPSNGALKREIEEDDPEAHTLKLNRVSRAFAEHELTCGVYLPSDGDPKNLDTLISETVAAMHPTDACVLDWQLRVGDAQPAIEAIKSVLNNDKNGGGRLRLVLVYTAEELNTASKQLLKALRDAGQEVELAKSGSAPVITGKHFRIAFANKPTRGRNPDEDDAVIGWDGLPDKIITEFTILSRGLLRAFALQSVAAVRRDMHRILAQFDEELDPAYAGDRATKPDPEDAARLVLEILQSELALSVSAGESALGVLSREASTAWLESWLPNAVDVDCKAITLHSQSKKIKTIDRSFRRKLINEGAADIKRAESTADISRAFFLDSEKWEPSSERYAILSSVAYHSGSIARREPKKRPTLTFGTVIGNRNGELLCLQPACDTVRINGKTAFLFVRLISGPADFDLLVPVGNKLKRYEIPETSKRKHLREIRTIWFKPRAGEDTIFADLEPSGEYKFKDTRNVNWTWRAQLRDVTAIQLAQKTIRAVGRVGLNEFEWLRTSAR